MVSRPTGRSAHRPQVPFRQHPDRYRVALAESIQLLGMKSKRKAALTTILFSEACREVPPWGDTAPPPACDNEAIGFEKIVRAGAAATLKGRAENIRKQWARWPHEAGDEEWLLCMSWAFCFCFNGNMHPYAIKQIVRRLAAEAGETSFAEKVMFPMIDAKTARR
jgi:hypothetical protein